MARLYDRVMAGDVAAPAEGSLRLDVLRGIPVVVVDNVVEMAMHERVTWDPVADFPNIAPPFERFWVETRKPQTSAWFDVDDAKEMAGVPSWGAYITSREVSEGDDMGPDAEGARWELSIAVFMDLKARGKRAILAPLGLLQIAVDPMGRPLTQRWATYTSNPVHDEVQKEEAQFLAYPLLVAVCFMHCKNVERVTVDQPPRLSKKWQKKHGRPLVRYHVLDIDPMRKVLRDEGKSEETGLKKALHICRGHFATYTEDAPLFGKVTGTFWRPQHIRGSKKQGLVLKDYNVKAPKSEPAA